MAQISIQELNVENMYKCLNLKLAEDQVDRIAPNVYSIAESKVNSNFTPYAIHLDDEVIGFVMTEFDPTEIEERKYWIPRFMIDVSYQRKGYGKGAMQQVIDMFKKNDDCHYIGLSTEPDNYSALRFYESLGFINTGELLEEREAILLIKVRQ
ncbi:GNAT family N-acetyltransferase [Pseudalkalibacillus berkeleyi]|uniref:GNAT family N-acetyltransferase n=1 Tax=Pseudalkalibacillus berkeleyi TaxID=1069813 RepID=A0ABS9H157_9BACL|nr:GNAT family N-acetyltransferase [Pseudalkalibacillus berkeleyi]MCF6137756.1 GNAT family N-acetyltransferase [Pseudalkalibacillus berkeleyi]